MKYQHAKRLIDIVVSASVLSILRLFQVQTIKLVLSKAGVN